MGFTIPRNCPIGNILRNQRIMKDVLSSNSNTLLDAELHESVVTVSPGHCVFLVQVWGKRKGEAYGP